MRSFLMLPGILLLPITGCGSPSQANISVSPPARERLFDELLTEYADLTYDELVSQTPERDCLDQLSFKPEELEFYNEAVKELQLTESEQELLKKNGFVSVDHQQRYSFGSLYYAIYSRDLPVLVTTDSILHALHRSYDILLEEIETNYLAQELETILRECHSQLGQEYAGSSRRGALADSARDLDIFLSVARNLLAGAGAPVGRHEILERGGWNGQILIPSFLEQGEEVLRILQLVRELRMQRGAGDATSLYGTARAIDYSQFKPRGHYTESLELQRYLRAMMWLGRADTGWNVLPPDPQSIIVADSERELRNTVLLTELLQTTGNLERLRRMSDILDFFIGQSDNLTAFQVRDLMKERGITSARQLDVARFQDALRDGPLGTQQIRSQLVLSHPAELYQPPPPRLFQLFGQRYVIDSFVLSKMVYDSIIFEGKKVQRHMPSGLDVMYALGNETTLPLLESELADYPYSANLKASRDFVGQHQPAFWQESVYNIWLDAIRVLDDKPTIEEGFPEVMRTRAWQRKQLQTQLASWAELRHDTLLYAKQSYGGGVLCEYPSGYVEPYPEFYAKLAHLAQRLGEFLEATDWPRNGDSVKIQERQISFCHAMVDVMGKLETLARKELAAEPFTAAEQDWIKKTIDSRKRGSGFTTYSGWYCDLIYGGRHKAGDWVPTIADVHTDPNKQETLQVGVGNCNFLVVAIDNEQQRRIYVGPAYSYYEFKQPAAKRRTDIEWGVMLLQQQQPPRPEWVSSFQPEAKQRYIGVGMERK